jgi:hypothetical protein
MPPRRRGHAPAPWCAQERREAKLAEELEKFRAENPKIQEQFADLKRKLADVPIEQVWAAGRAVQGCRGGPHARLARCTAVGAVNACQGQSGPCPAHPQGLQPSLLASGCCLLVCAPGMARKAFTLAAGGSSFPSCSARQWEAIPDIGDYTVKKLKQLDRFTPVPDSLLAGAAARDATATAIDASGLATPMGGATTDLTAIGAGRNTVVQLKLDKISDSVSGQTVVDPKGYLTDLKSVTLKSGEAAALGGTRAARANRCRGWHRRRQAAYGGRCVAVRRMQRGFEGCLQAGWEAPVRVHSPLPAYRLTGTPRLCPPPTRLPSQMPRSATSRRRGCCSSR